MPDMSFFVPLLKIKISQKNIHETYKTASRSGICSPHI